MWSQPVAILDGEDEDKLKADFVVFAARYPKRDPFEIAAYVFRNQVDPALRSKQAALVWSADLEICERIRLARLNGGNEPSEVDDEDTMLRKLEAIYDDADQPVKERIAAMRLHAEIKGRVKKVVDKTVDDTRRNLPTFVITQYSDE